MAYIQPQVQVFQEFSQLPANVTANLNAFVFGPNYKLFRYAQASEKLLVGLGDYHVSHAQVYDYPNQPAGSTVDLAYIKLYMDDVWAQYASIAAGGAAPLVVQASNARNKLRAMPLIDSADEPTTTNGVVTDVGGCYNEGPDLPEALYFWPTGGAVDGYMSRLLARTSLWSIEDSALAHRAVNSGAHGVTSIPASDHPLQSGTTIQGPYGIVFDMDAGTRTAAVIEYTGQPANTNVLVVPRTGGSTTYRFMNVPVAPKDVLIGTNAAATYDNLRAFMSVDLAADAAFSEVVHVRGITPAVGTVLLIGKSPLNITTGGSTMANTTLYVSGSYASVRQPVILTFSDTVGTSLFTMTVAEESIGDATDRAIDDGIPTKVNLVAASGATAIAWDDVNDRLTITYEPGVTTLEDLRAALVADSDVAARFDISEIDGNELQPVDVIADESTSPEPEGWDINMLPDVYRVRVLPNDITWATANGYSHSAIFKSRGVKVGDSIRYSVVAPDTLTYAGTSMVAGLEADTVAAIIDKPTAESTNISSVGGDELLPHTGAPDLVVPGADNIKMFVGTVFALSDRVPYLPGDYASGLLSESFTVEITVAGAAGTARATVSTVSGSYIRTNVQIVPVHWDIVDPTRKAMLYLGENLWMMFTRGPEADLLFELGDTYTFDTALQAPWSVISGNRFTSDGAYVGPVDTTYKVEVTRGGVFTRVVNAIDGLQTPSRVVITYTGRPSDATTFEIGGLTFEIDTTGGGVTPGNIQVDVSGSGSDDADYTILASVINAQAVGLYAMQDTVAGTLTIRGGFGVLGYVDGLDNATTTDQSVLLVPSVDFDNTWLGGDTDDEYILRCTASGTLVSAKFALTSQGGDDVSLLEFGGTGIANTIDIGTRGLSGYFYATSPTIVFSTGDYWVIKVNGTRPQVTISDSAGIDQGSVVVVDHSVDFNVGLYGVTANFSINPNYQGGFAPYGGLVTGDIFYITAKAVADGPIKTLILADDLPSAALAGLEVDVSGATPVTTANYAPSVFASWLYLIQNGALITSKRTQIPPQRNWTATVDEISINSAIQVQDPDWTEVDGSMPWLNVYAGSMYLEYRALIMDYSDGIYSLNAIGDVVTELGTVTPDNPLAQGVYNALLNSGGQSVYFMAVASDDLAGYSAVLEQASKTDVVYGFAPLTRDAQILDAVGAHVTALSSPSEKRWRRAFVGAVLPTEAAVVNASTFTPPGTEWQATITDNPSLVGVQNTLVTVTNGTPHLLADVHAGDVVRCMFGTDAWGDATYQSYVVHQVLTNSKLLLESGPAVPISVAAKFEIWHPYSVADMATAVAATSRAYANLRICNVFPDVGYLSGVAMTSEFMAAAVAGLESSVAPQQGLTNIAITGFDDVPSVYATFTRDQLNEMAGAGTMILMQNMAGDQIYIRHQVTTATVDGNLLTQELSVGKNLDAISYYFATVLSPFIGRYNITPQLLTVIETQIQNGINYLGSNRTAVGLLGPMIILGANTKINSVSQHPTLRDHVYASVDLELPLPVNVIQLHLVV